jgi:hypothetical protein
MKERIRFIAVAALVCSYLLPGAIGHLGNFILSGFGDDPQHITKPAGNQSTVYKIYWAQYKHIPSMVKIPVPSPAIFTAPETSYNSFCETIAVMHKTVVHPEPSSSTDYSRAPPYLTGIFIS